jgi:hypothetical protein
VVAKQCFLQRIKKMKKDFAGTRKSFTLGSLDEGSSSFDNPKQKS